MENFKGVSPHRPLAADDSEVRVIELFPGGFGEPIFCELAHVSLSPDADYEALSYCWGDYSVTKDIMLDERPYPITTSLFTALQYLRLDDKPRVLWVDSLCINQLDNDERSRQVPRMRDIYLYASDVLIWVGDYHPFSRSHVKDVFEYFRIVATTGEETLLHAAIYKYGLEGIQRRNYAAREFLDTRPWFRRTWVIQELAVRSSENPETTPRLICGRLQIPMGVLARAQEKWSSYRKDYPDYMSQQSFHTGLEAILEIWWSHQNPDQVGIRSLQDQMTVTLYSAAGDNLATDHRDTMYALIGLLTIGPLPRYLQPDYNKPIPQVLCEYAKWLLEDSWHLYSIQWNSGLTPGLPSWVPDWKHRGEYPAFQSGPIDYPGMHISISDDMERLETNVLRYTTIKTTVSSFRASEETSDIPSQLDQFFQKIDLVSDHLHDPVAHMSFRRRLYMLLILFHLRIENRGNRPWYGKLLRRSAYFLPRYDASLLDPLLAKSRFCVGSDFWIDSYDAETLWSEVAVSMADRALFICHDGSIGITLQPQVTPIEGDLIGSIPGAPGEFILRQVQSGFSLVGNCKRTVRGFDFRIEDVTPGIWISQAYNEKFHQDLWANHDLERIVIH